MLMLGRRPGRCQAGGVMGGITPPAPPTTSRPGGGWHASRSQVTESMPRLRLASRPRLTCHEGHGASCQRSLPCHQDISVELAQRRSKSSKVRLDALCQQAFPQHSKMALQSWILQGKVTVDDKVVNKAGQQVHPSAKVQLYAEDPKYVCRAGHKLEKALQHFNIQLQGKVALDSGQSTGGFSDCLLQHGIQQVLGVDVGYGQLADKIRQDPRVMVKERCNLRYLKPEDVPCKVDLVCLDLSFISVLKVLPAVMGLLKPEARAELVVLIKPQFEAGQAEVCRGGVVRDPKVHESVIARISSGVEAWGFRCVGVCESPIKGEKAGNKEFLAYFVRDPVTSGGGKSQAAVAEPARAIRLAAPLQGGPLSERPPLARLSVR